MTSKIIAALVVLLVAIQGCLGIGCETGIQNPPHPPDTCFLSKVCRMPPWHIYHRLRCQNRPLVMGHRGNVQLAQENSFDSIEGVLRHGADGFEVDVFLTADNQFVCFHDKNTSRLTGVNGDIEAMTTAQIQALEYQKVIQYGSQQKVYSKKRPIAFLNQVLQWAKKKRLLVYVEMKPEPTLDPLARPLQIQRSILMGTLLAQLIQSQNMLNQTIVNSFDVVKSLFAKKSVNDLVVGTSWTPGYWLLPAFVHDLQKLELEALYPGLCTCLTNIPTANSVFINFLFQSGTVEKSIGASFTDLEFTMFNNSLYGGTSHTMCMLKRNYGYGTAVGAYTLHDLSKTQAQIQSEKPVYESLLRDGVDLFYTDNICRMVRLVEQTLPNHYPYNSNYSQHRRRYSSHRRRSYSSRRRHHWWGRRHRYWPRGNRHCPGHYGK